jgi:methionyl-tRNA synthetase
MARRYFISTTIPYVNAPPHLGHAFEFLQADAFARHHRLTGDDVYFLSGSDENSLKNVLAAEAEGIPTAELVERNVRDFLALKDPLTLSYDRFIRTSLDEEHILGAGKLWGRLEQAGDVYKRVYGGLYCVGCEQFYTEDELLDGLCPEHATPPEFVEEENYFFRLSRYRDQLDDLIASRQIEILPETRRNEVLSFVRAGLRDFSISRSQLRARGWGIPVPSDPSQVMYVWVDALTNYINALGYADETDMYHRYWRDAGDRVHVLGKGVIRFHAVYWPAMLLSAGVPLPTKLFVHGYITLSGAKLSKSSGNPLDVLSLVQKYGAEPLRYFLLRHVPPTGDADFSPERLVESYNTDLANGLGNLMSRLVRMIDSYRDGEIPAPGLLDHAADALRRTATEATQRVVAAMDAYDHREALIAVWDVVRATNAYIHGATPWELARKDDAAAASQLNSALHTASEAVRLVGLMLRPFLPVTAQAVLERIGATESDTPSWDPAVLPGRQIHRAPSLFPRIVVSSPDATVPAG